MSLNASLTRRSAEGALVRLEHVTKQFGKKIILSNINLSLYPGEFVAIVGQSGSGKSTFLRIIAGLDLDYEGQIAVEAQSGKTAARIMFQEPRLLPWANIIDNVVVGLGSGISRRHALPAACNALKAVGLDDRASEWPSVLSGGQKQRVALARALVSAPSLLALDEPLGALDALTRLSMQRLLEQVWLKQGFTAVLVTHDVSEALALADRVIMIDEGRIVLDQPVPFARPRRQGTIEFKLQEEKILTKLLKSPLNSTDYVI